MFKCKYIISSGEQCSRLVAKKSEYCWQHMKQKNELIGGYDSKTPIIELYEFKIEKYSNQKNSFPFGFQKSETNCGRIFAQNEVYEKNMNISSCDYIVTGFMRDWETVFDENLGMGFESKELTNFRLIKDIYFECKNIPSKSQSNELIKNKHWKKFCEKWGFNLIQTIESLKQKYKLFFEQQNIGHEFIKKNSYIQKINVDKNVKIIMMGDLHGSIHTFLRHLFRLYIMGVIDIHTFKINPDYRLIFLGDVVDRGFFSLEITLIIVKLMEINNIDLSDPLIIYNKGNHESQSLTMKYGFQKEIMERCDHNSSTKIFNKINELYLYLSSAIILEIGHSYRYWLCHGGFDPSMLNPSSKITQTMKNSRKPIIPFIDEFQQMNVKWSDFIDDLIAEGPEFNEKRGLGYVYNKLHVYQFCKLHNIHFIVRGHQDSYSNNYLFSPKYIINDDDNPFYDQIMPGFSLSDRSKYGTSIIGNDGIKVVEYNHKFSEQFPDRSIGPIATLLADCTKYFTINSRLGLPYYYASVKNTQDYVGNSMRVYPVLTISTNTDLDRPLKADSFVVLGLT